MNERKKKIIEQIQAGIKLSQKDLRDMLKKELGRSWSISQIKRDIRELRDAGLIATHRDGHYVIRSD